MPKNYVGKGAEREFAEEDRMRALLKKKKEKPLEEYSNPKPMLEKKKGRLIKTVFDVE